MDAIDYLRFKFAVSKDKTLVDEIGTRMYTDIVIRLMDEFGKQQWNTALDEVLELTYKQTLESGATVDVIERTDIIKLKK